MGLTVEMISLADFGYAMQEILYGSLENVKIEKEKVHTSTDYFCAYDGIIDYLQKVKSVRPIRNV